MKKISKISILVMSCMAFTIQAGSGHLNYSWGIIQSARDSSCLQAVGDRLQFQPCDTEQKAQRWLYTPEGNLRFKADDGDLSDVVVDIPTESDAKAGTLLQLYSVNEGASSQWEWASAVHESEKKWILASRWSKASNMCLAHDNSGFAALHACDDTDKTLLFINSPSGLDAFDSFPEAGLSYFGIDKANWMAHIFKNNQNISLKSTVLVGTHNAGTYEGFSAISRTQRKTVLQQLNDGIRYLDLRTDMRVFKGLVITHGCESGYSGSVEVVLREIKAFAKLHPKEVIIIDLQEVPDIKSADDKQGLNNIKELAEMIKNILGNYVIARTNKLTFKEIWEAQEGQIKKRNLVLMVKNFKYFDAAHDGDFYDYMWDRKAYLKDTWPESTNFEVIYTKNTNRLLYGRHRMHVSQLIRTPGKWFAFATVAGFQLGPYQLTWEKTDDGYFNYAIDKWLNDWVNIDNIVPNIVEADFYEESNLIPMALWLNIKQYMKNIEFDPNILSGNDKNI